MTSGEVLLRVEDRVAWVSFSNPGKRNAFTWGMYDRLSEILDGLGDIPDLRAVIFRGNPEDGFAAGTDIRQFVDFRSGQQGVDYENRVGRILTSLSLVAVPVIALVEGAAVGAGLAIVAFCDLIIAERGALFGAPIGRTLGNCLPAPVVARLRSRLGPSRTDGMLLTASLIPAEDLAAGGFVFQLVDAGGLDEAAARVLGRIRTSAPMTLRALKETARRLDAVADTPNTDDLLRECYGSDDFREGVSAFVEQRHPVWKGH